MRNPQKVIKLTVVMFLICDYMRALGASAINSQSDTYHETVIEYYKDHEVTEKQARDSLRSMKESEFVPPAHCKPCSSEHKRYCSSENLLKDHCCCNQSHKKGKV
jgi:hypothetical protein